MSTTAVHGGEPRPGPQGSVVFPIYQGTVYEIPPGTAYGDIKYIRFGTTPTQAYVQDKIAALEGAEACVVTASGMAALAAILIAVLEPGDHFLAATGLYGGSHSFVTRYAERCGWTCSFVDPLDPRSWEAAATPETRLFLLESISNPLMRVPRLERAAAFCRARSMVSVVDNTFATPVNFKPLRHGFDLSFHSGTKYLNGHSDVAAGCVVGPAEQMSRIRETVTHLGGALDPHAAFLLGRGLKTLALRVEAQNATAEALSRFLDGRAEVANVNYPGLPRHADHIHASAVMSGFGGMLSFRLRAGSAAAAEALMARLRIPYVAGSLGGVETLLTRPAATSHAGMSAEERARQGITDDLIRVSCGIENAEDLLLDFEHALDAAGA